MVRVRKQPSVFGARVEVMQRLEERDWAGLFPELVSKIADHLRPQPPGAPRNWLLLAGERLRCDGEPERFVNVRTGASLRIRLPDTQEYTHHGNAEGLLLLHHILTDTICLLNPLTMAFTDLPTMLAVDDVSRPRGEYPNHVYRTDSIKAAGIVVDVNELGRALSLPMVVLSLKTTGTNTAIVCAEPGDYVWRAVDTSCTDGIEGKQPTIQGGLIVRGRFYVPTRAGDVLTVELQPQPQLRYLARMTG